MPHRSSIRLKRKEKAGKNHLSPQARFDFLLSLPVIVLVVAFYFWTAMTNGKYPDNSSSVYYPLLGRAFLEGQLYLDVQPLPELLALPDPYDPILNRPYRLHDASLYHGKYYLYFGPTPAILLFEPCLILTDHYYPQKMAVPLFCSLGFIFSALLFLMLLQNHFPEVPLWLKLAALFSLGMADACPFLIRRPDVYETAISCAYGLLQLVFLSFYYALRKPQHALRWLLFASTCLGACVGARPNYCLIVIVFVAVLIWWWWQNRSRRKPRSWSIFLALAPVGFIGLLLAWYNYARFDTPFEVGHHYQLAAEEFSKLQYMQIDNMPYNIWFYFFSPPHLSWGFPFIDALPYAWFQGPSHHYSLEKVTGLFVISPVSLFALTLPVLLRKAGDPVDRPLVLTLVFIAGASIATLLSILPICGATMRCCVDFAPGFVFLGCIMMCHFHACVSQKKWMMRWLLQGLFMLILFLGCGNGLLLSFTGYYDYLRLGSPETYTALKQCFHPLEVVLKAIVDLFGA